MHSDTYIYRQMYGDKIKIDYGKGGTTPYGGRIQWKLPGENSLVLHLKDKSKIRHRKRWSQVTTCEQYTRLQYS